VNKYGIEGPFTRKGGFLTLIVSPKGMVLSLVLACIVLALVVLTYLQ